MTGGQLTAFKVVEKFVPDVPGAQTRSLVDVAALLTNVPATQSGTEVRSGLGAGASALGVGAPVFGAGASAFGAGASGASAGASTGVAGWANATDVARNSIYITAMSFFI